MRLGAGPLQNKIELTVRNCFAKAVQFAAFHQTGKAWRDPSGTVGVSTAMLRTTGMFSRARLPLRLCISVYEREREMGPT